MLLSQPQLTCSHWGEVVGGRVAVYGETQMAVMRQVGSRYYQLHAKCLQCGCKVTGCDIKRGIQTGGRQ